MHRKSSHDLGTKNRDRRTSEREKQKEQRSEGGGRRRRRNGKKGLINAMSAGGRNPTVRIGALRETSTKEGKTEVKRYRKEIWGVKPKIGALNCRGDERKATTKAFLQDWNGKGKEKISACVRMREQTSRRKKTPRGRSTGGRHQKPRKRGEHTEMRKTCPAKVPTTNKRMSSCRRGKKRGKKKFCHDIARRAVPATCKD